MRDERFMQGSGVSAGEPLKYSIGSTETSKPSKPSKGLKGLKFPRLPKLHGVGRLLSTSACGRV